MAQDFGDDLVFLFGAGASVMAGVPAVRKLTGLFKENLA
jgi:NAD-dependent SIR2 family protein deacetylase